jgi:uncharacterized protein (DUF1330 family)
MKVENRVYPDPEQTAALQKADGPGGRIVMVNLLKFRERARYRDGRDAHLTGREAYERYAVEVGKLVRACGGRVVYVGDVTFLSLGRVDELWDEVALAEYPSRAAFLRMSSSPEWRTIAEHREAGLEGQLNIETTPSALGEPAPEP